MTVPDLVWKKIPTSRKAGNFRLVGMSNDPTSFEMWSIVPFEDDNMVELCFSNQQEKRPEGTSTNLKTIACLASEAEAKIAIHMFRKAAQELQTTGRITLESGTTALTPFDQNITSVPGLTCKVTEPGSSKRVRFNIISKVADDNNASGMQYTVMKKGAPLQITPMAIFIARTMEYNTGRPLPKEHLLQVEMAIMSEIVDLRIKKGKDQGFEKYIEPLSMDDFNTWLNNQEIKAPVHNQEPPEMDKPVMKSGQEIASDMAP